MRLSIAAPTCSGQDSLVHFALCAQIDLASMKLPFLLLLQLLASLGLGVCAIPATGSKSFLRGLETQTAVVCRVMQIDVQYDTPKGKDDDDDDDDENDVTNGADNNAMPAESYVCITDTDEGAVDMAFAIDLADDLLNQLNLHDDSKSWISISSAIVDYANAAIVILDDAQVTVVPSIFSNRRRRLAPTMGKSTLLVLRVTYRDQAPSLTAANLASSVFGLGEKAANVNLADQMEACSFGKLLFSPAKGSGIVHGVAEISINVKVSGDNSVRTLEILVIDKANKEFGTLSQLYEHVIIVMPEAGLKYGGNGYLAYAFLRGFISVYDNLWAGRISALSHEIGHNLNLHHAGHGSLPYGDESGYMGFGSVDEQSPKSCFNAQKHWSLGWFQDRSLSLDTVDLPWAGYVAAFVDYNMTTPDQLVVLNVGKSDPRLFLQYNRAKGVNAETRELGDQIVIIRDNGSPETYWGLQSWREGGVAVDQEGVGRAFRYHDFGGPGVDLIIRACEVVSGEGSPDYIRLSIHLDDGVQKHTCRDDIARGSDDLLCDDDLTATFYVQEKDLYRSCGWLARNIDRWRSRLCVPGEDAYSYCAETCGKCSDDCVDKADSSFFVNNVQKNQNCEWLSTRLSWQERLCIEGELAFEMCHESCNRCG